MVVMARWGPSARCPVEPLTAQKSPMLSQIYPVHAHLERCETCGYQNRNLSSCAFALPNEVTRRAASLPARTDPLGLALT